MSTRIAIAHDYLVQSGKAERVVSDWAEQLPDAEIYTLAYRSRSTYELFERRTVVTPRFGKSRPFVDSLEYLLPLLPAVAASVQIPSTVDLVLASTSGFAHGFKCKAPLIAYCHSPARWLYEYDDYRKGLQTYRRLALKCISPYLRRADQHAASRVTRYIANSEVTRRRIRAAYKIDAPVVHPPVHILPTPEAICGVSLPETFALCVARAKGYKNLSLAIEACQTARVPLILVGSGTDRLDVAGVAGLGRVSDSELAYLYAHASVLLGVAHEDFGLTPIEAALYRTPTVAINYGGYRETVVHGRTGLLVDETSNELACGINAALKKRWRDMDFQCTADKFSREKHMAAILEIARVTV